MFRLRPLESRESVENHAVAAVGNRADVVAEDRVDHYLSLVAKRLDVYAPEVREGILREVRQHVEALIVAGEELGLDRDASITTALDRFGSSEQLARRFRRAHEQMLMRSNPVAYYGPVVLWGASLMTVCLTSVVNYNPSTPNVCASLLALAFPILSSAIASYRREPGAEMAGVLLFVNLTIPFLWLAYNFVSGFAAGGIGPAFAALSVSPLPAEWYCFVAGWLAAPYLTRAIVAHRGRQVAR